MRAIITSANKSHDKVMISHDSVMQEEKRREEKRRDKKKREETPDKPAKSPKTQTRRILSRTLDQ